MAATKATDETTPRTPPPENTRRGCHRAIAQACAVGVGTVSEYLARARAAGVAGPLPADLDDAALEARLFARPPPPKVSFVIV